MHWRCENPLVRFEGGGAEVLVKRHTQSTRTPWSWWRRCTGSGPISRRRRPLGDKSWKTRHRCRAGVVYELLNGDSAVATKIQRGIRAQRQHDSRLGLIRPAISAALAALATSFIRTLRRVRRRRRRARICTIRLCAL